MLKKIGLGLAATITVLIAAFLIFAWQVGAWNVLFPSKKHETTPPEITQDSSAPAVLVFSKTNGFRHKDGIAGGISFFNGLGAKKGWTIFHSENGAIFNPDDLSRFSVVIFNNVTGDVLSRTQQLDFQAWLEEGGAWLGIHGAGDKSHSEWFWYVNNLIGSTFIAHTMGPQFQVATVHKADTSHIAMRHVPDSWQHNEEWYSWQKSVREKGFNVLLTVDESTYNPRMIFLGMDQDLRMGDHPVVWNRCVGKGRSLYSALGHSGEAFETAEYQALLEGAMIWLMDATNCAEAE